MEIEKIVKEELNSVEKAIIRTLDRNGGKFNRLGLLGGYSCRSNVTEENGEPIHVSKLHPALEHLGEMGLVSMSMNLELVLDRDEWDIYQEVSENKEMYDLLISAAATAQKNSWSPYSKFKVGSAVLATGHEVATGTNFENAAYGATICAERGAIGSAVKSGYLNPEEDKFIRAIVAILPSNEFGRPCGACRQVIKEFSKPDGNSYVVMANQKGEADVRKIGYILPDSFGPFELGVVTK